MCSVMIIIHLITFSYSSVPLSRNVITQISHWDLLRVIFSNLMKCALMTDETRETIDR